MRSGDDCECGTGVMRTYRTITRGDGLRTRYLRCACCGETGKEIFRVVATFLVNAHRRRRPSSAKIVDVEGISMLSTVEGAFMAQQFLSPATFAKSLDITIDELVRRISTGSVPTPEIVGGLVRWSADDVDRWHQNRWPQFPVPRNTQFLRIELAIGIELDQIVMDKINKWYETASPEALARVERILASQEQTV